MPENTAVYRRQRLKNYNRDALMVLLLWTVMVAGSYIWNDQHNRRHAGELAIDRARTILSRDVALRRWATRHGGVYVPVSDRTPPNPQLAHLPERDITTPSGRHLTLMNPAYMLRQVVTEFSDATASTHLTSLKPMRQENTPDAWEAEGLRALEKGAREVVAIVEGPKGAVARLMMPFYVDHPNCLTCHGSMGYRLGDVRGGISATVSLSPYLAMDQKFMRQVSAFHGAIWLLGAGVVWIVARRNRRTLVQQLSAQEQLAESRLFLEEIINGIQDLVVVIDRQYRVVLSNWQGVADADRGQGALDLFCYGCFHGRSAPCDDCHLTRVFAGETVVVEKVDTHDGVPREITAYPYRDADGTITMAIEVVRDIGERREMESALRASEERFRRFAEQAQDVIYRLRILPKPAFEYVSPAVTAMTGYPPGEWLEDANIALRVTHPDDIQTVMDIFSGTMPTEGLFTLRILTKGGGVIWTEHRITPLTDQQGGVWAIDAIARDMTRQMETTRKLESFSRELEQRVSERTLELEQSTRELEEFCYSIAHDLRGPLRSINSNAHLLEAECPHAHASPDCAEILKRISKATTHMGSLMDLLLELGRISRMPLYGEVVDLSVLCRRLAAALTGRDTERNALITIPDGMRLTADPAMMERLMELLLENAWKFTARKPVTVIEVQQSWSNNETVIMVRDNGVGFDMTHAGNLFKAFRRLHRYDEFDGPGMGLAIARRIVERHGGRIWAEGEAGSGATFFVALPLSPHAGS